MQTEHPPTQTHTHTRTHTHTHTHTHTQDERANGESLTDATRQDLHSGTGGSDVSGHGVGKPGRRGWSWVPPTQGGGRPRVHGLLTGLLDLYGRKTHRKNERKSKPFIYGQAMRRACLSSYTRFSGFFFPRACKDLGRMFDYPFPVCAFY